MTNLLTPLSPRDVAERLEGGHAVLIDIREPDEFARRHIPGALSTPLSKLDPGPLVCAPGVDIIFTCRTGMRTAGNAAKLAAAAGNRAHVLVGGVDAWAAAGLPVSGDPAAPLEMMRQVQIAAGVLVLAGVLLGLGVSPGWFGLAAFVGAGLTFAGVTGFCGMARVLAFMPWNRRSAA